MQTLQSIYSAHSNVPKSIVDRFLMQAIIQYFDDSFETVEGFFDYYDDEAFEDMPSILEQFFMFQEDKIFVVENLVKPSASMAIKAYMSGINQKVMIKHWNHQETGSTATFEVSIDNQLESNGQIYIDIATDGGDIHDDVLPLTVEINHLPDGSNTDTQCLHVHFDQSNMAFSLFKQKEGYILRPETDVEISSRIINDELMFIVQPSAI